MIVAAGKIHLEPIGGKAIVDRKPQRLTNPLRGATRVAEEHNLPTLALSNREGGRQIIMRRAASLPPISRLPNPSKAR